MPLMPIKLEQVLFDRRAESVQGNDVLADVRVHAQRDVGSRLANPVERGERHDHVVTDASDVDNETCGGFFDERSL